MADRIVHFDDLTIQRQCIGDIHVLAENQIPKRAGDAGFAVAGRSVHENGCTGVERRSEPLEGGFGDHQLGKDLAHRARGDGEPPAFLAADGFVIDFERDGSRSCVLAALQRFPRANDARASDAIRIGALTQTALRRFHLDEFFLFQGGEQLIGHTGKRQGDFFGNLEARQITTKIQYFKNEVLQP